MILYFSGTGNSRHVAKRLAELLGERLLKVADAINDGVQEFSLADGESVGWVFPTYSWGPAPIVADYAQKVRFVGATPDTYSYLVTTCGDEVGLTAQMWRELPLALDCKAAFSVQMPNNYILLPGFDVDDKATETEKRDAAEARIAAIAQAVKARQTADDVVVGPWPKLKSKLIYPLFVKFYMSDKGFAAEEDACVRCGLCAQVCPNKNITINENGLPEWGGNCAMCLSCIHRCPVKAIQYGKVTKKKGRYHF